MILHDSTAMIVIDFDNTYSLDEIASDLSYTTFTCTNKAGNPILLRVEILSLGNPLLPNVYNFAFGPLLPNGKIDDGARVHHKDKGKVFSTLLFFALNFLKANPKSSIGLDGSNDVRAYLYHRMILLNRSYLQKFFVAVGVDWHVRLMRDGSVEMDQEGYPFFKPRPETFDYKRPARDLYRYYIFYLK